MTTHQTATGIYIVVANLQAVPTPPPPPTIFFALPNDITLQMGPTDANHVFVFPDDCVLTRCSLHGSDRIHSFNQVFASVDPAAPLIDLEFDLYIDGVFVQKLFTLPAGDTAIDLFANPNTPIPAGAEVQIAVNVPAAANGVMQNFIVSFATGPT